MYYRAWLPRVATTRALLILHREDEHSARVIEAAEAIAPDDIAVFAWDQRGHGQSPGGDQAMSVGALARDLEWFARHLTHTHGIDLPDTIVLGHGFSAVVTAAWAHDYAPSLRGMVLIAPALLPNRYLPFAIPALRLRRKLLGPGSVRSITNPRFLMRDDRERRAFARDPGIRRRVSIDLLLDVHDTGTRLVRDAGAITTPTLLLTPERDLTVGLSAQRKFYQRLGSRIKATDVVRGFHHALFHEPERQQVFSRLRGHVAECFERPRQTWPDRELLVADYGGYTKTEFDSLRFPGGLGWSLVRGAANFIAPLSEGLRLGARYGFGSIPSQEYVQAHRPAGHAIVGRLIDRLYLASPSAQSLQIRRQHILSLALEAIGRLREGQGPLHILDIAAGRGRNVLDLLAEVSKCTATLRDVSETNLAAALRMAATMSLTSRLSVVPGDPFDAEALAAIAPRPQIALACGAYEECPQNLPVRTSLSALAAAIEPGGYLIYTCQPWHPKLQLIARTGDRKRSPWNIRRRTQQEMDVLVREAGFEKLDQLIDPWGICTVCLARKAAD